MSKSTRNQSYWVQQFLSNQTNHKKDLETIGKGWYYVHESNPKRYTFWTNPLNEESLRLSRSGFQWVKDCTSLPFWKVSIKTEMLPKTFLKLEKALSAPYYIDNLKSLTVFSEEDLIMIQLHAGDLETYLDNIIDTE